MAIRQDRYVAADTNKIKKVDIIEVPQVPDDPVLRRSDVQQQVNNSTLPVSSRAVKLEIESINSDLNLKADKTELEGLATKDYVNEKIDEKEVGITEPELISKSVGSGKWMRERAYGVGSVSADTTPLSDWGELANGVYRVPNSSSLDKPNFYQTGAVGLRVGWDGGYYNVIYTSPQNQRAALKSVSAGADKGWAEFLTDVNTYPDSNGVLHNSRNPIDTLNTSDMADTVVDNDLLTVTSGAVFRAIKQLTDQITSLEARVRELEDGGV